MGYNDSGPEAVFAHRPGLTRTSILTRPGDAMADTQSTEPVPLRQCLADLLAAMLADETERPRGEVA